MTVDPRLIERLRKLQAMAERPSNEAEGEVAAMRLAELMARHQVEQADLAGGDAPVGVEDARIDAEENAPMPRIERWELELASVVAEMCGGRAWYHQSPVDRRRMIVRMYGPPGSVGAARYMYMWLRRQVADYSRAASRDQSNAWRRGYASGMVAKIYQRMRDARRAVVETSSSTALVVIDRQRQAIDARYEAQDLTPRRSRELKRPDARVTGWREGDRVDLGDSGAARIGEGPRRLKA